MSSASARSTSLRGIARGANSSRIRYRIHRRKVMGHPSRSRWSGHSERHGARHHFRGLHERLSGAAEEGRSPDIRTGAWGRDFMIGRTRDLTNAKGPGPLKPGHRTRENVSFEPNFVLEVRVTKVGEGEPRSWCTRPWKRLGRRFRRAVARQIVHKPSVSTKMKPHRAKFRWTGSRGFVTRGLLRTD